MSPPPETRGDDPRAGEARGDDGIDMRWSSPTGASPPALSAWYLANTEGLIRVERAWAALVRRMAGHHPARFESQCAGLASSLEELDRPSLLPVPDPVIDLYVKRLLRHLRHAVRACRSEELFNVIYHLEEARSSLSEMRWLLASRRVTGRSSTLVTPTPGTGGGPGKD